MSAGNGQKKKASRTLIALAGSALGLPGISGKALAVTQGEAEVDYSYSLYQEEDMPREKQSGATSDTERYTIDTHQLRVVRPWGDTYDLTVDLLYETMSGASPWYVLPNPDPNQSEKPLQVMSGASGIEDTRKDVLAKVRKIYDDSAGAVSLGYSTEDDYTSVNMALEGVWELDDKQKTVTLGIGGSDDDIEPVDTHRFPGRVEHETKTSISAYAGLSMVIDAQTIVQSSVSFTRQNGFLSDPYKLAFVSGTLVQDSRPDGREQFTWLTRLRRFFPEWLGALHADYRFYDDDWGVESHTIDLGWHQNFSGQLQLIPSIRYYTQSQAYFYAPYYNAPRNDNFASSDYRLSPYGALSFRLDAVKKIGTWAFRLGWEMYDSDSDLAIKSVKVENPGLIEFSNFRISISKYF